MKVLKRIVKGILLEGEASAPTDVANGAIWYDSVLNKLRAYLGGSARSVVSEDQTQTLTNKTIDADSNTITNIENADIKSGAAIDATKIANGSVSNTEFQYLDGVTSAIQTQLDGKEPTITGAATTITSANLTADRALQSNGSGKVAVSAVTSTELGYVSGVTSAIQTQLNGKQATGNYITALTGDVTASGPGSVAATIANDAVTNAKLANVATQTIKGRTTAGTGDPEDLTATQVNTLLGTITSLTGDVTATGPGASASTIANDAVTNAKMANMAQSTIKGRAAGAGTGDPTDLTGTQATAILDTFTSSLQGLVPASGGGTTNFLRADGTFATPPSGQTLQTSEFTSSGSFVVPSTVSSIFILTGGGGAGGGGGGSTNGGGGGGGGGAPLLSNHITVTPSSTLTVTIGAGGTAGGANANGNAGGNTTITGTGVSIISPGGSGGGGGRAQGVSGNNASDSDMAVGGTGGTSAAGAGGGGGGGSSEFGGGNGGSGTGNTAGSTGFWGAGGGGGGGTGAGGTGGRSTYTTTKSTGGASRGGGGGGAGFAIGANGGTSATTGGTAAANSSGGGGGGGGNTGTGASGGAGGSGYVRIIYFS